MNNSLKILLAITLLNVSNAQGQNDSTHFKSKSGFEKLYYQLQVGIIASESDDTKDYRPAAGIGLGYEIHHLFQPGFYIGYEEHRLFESMPVAFQIQGSHKPTVNTMFYYFQLGKTAFWKNDRNIVESVNSGEYWEAGIGYQWLVDNLRLKISTGFRDQKFSSTWKNNDIWYWESFSSFAPQQGYREETHWHLERLHFKLTVEF